jgi:threonine dehydrogenase-like Zn-dependent dehydrogenase
VILERWIPCGHCDHCYNGDYRFCVRSVDGFNYGGSPTGLKPSLWGGFADYLYLHPDSVVYRVDRKVPAEVFPLFTPIGNGISWAVRTGGVRVGSTVVIQGPGQEGIGALIAANAAGAGTVIVTGLARDAFRLGLAREMGASATVVADEEDVVERVKELTNGELADVVVDVTSGSSAEPVAVSLDVARQGGTIVLASRHQDARLPDFAAGKITRKTLSIHGVRGRHRESVKAAIRLIESGRYPLERLCTHALPVEMTDRALRLAAGEEDGDVFHVSITP